MVVALLEIKQVVSYEAVWIYINDIQRGLSFLRQVFFVLTTCNDNIKNIRLWQ